MSVFHFKIDTWEFWHIQTHWFALDGGAMFGIVPKVLWEKKIKPDDKNRIPMGTNPLIVKTEKNLIMVDTGLGERWSEKQIEIYNIKSFNPWKSLPFGPEDIDYVILTHLHFDHAGGNVDKNLKPAFPKAKYVAQYDELIETITVHERNKASYRKEDYEPLDKQLDFAHGDIEIPFNVFLIKTGGHTKGHQIVLFRAPGKNVAYLGDLVPMIHHVPLPYIMAYDLHPVDTLNARKRIYPKAINEKWYLVFEHDRTPKRGYLGIDDRGKFYLEIQDLP